MKLLLKVAMSALMNVTDDIVVMDELALNQSHGNESTGWEFSCDWPSLTVASLLSVIVLLTIGGNLLILAAVLFNSNLRGPTHILIANLAVADLLLGFLVLPFSATLEVKTFFGCMRLYLDRLYARTGPSDC